MTSILGTGTADPPHRYAQEEIRAAARQAFVGMEDLDRLLSVFDHAGIERRAFVHPLDYHLAGHPFARRNRDWADAAVALGVQAIHACAEKADIPPPTFGTLIFTTTTGLSTPSVDALLVERAGLSPDIRRVPLFGIGCAGGAAGLALAASLAGERPALVLSVELCAQTLLLSDRSRTNVVGAALFADGAAAAAVGDGRGPRIVDSRSVLFPDSAGVMGWDFTDEGMRLVLTQEVPKMVERHVHAEVEDFLGEHGLDPGDVARWVLHPGGPRVIDAFGRVLRIPEERLRPTRTFLRDHGNLSSASVLYILDAATREAAPGEWGVVLSLGPGFAAEMILLRW